MNERIAGMGVLGALVLFINIGFEIFTGETLFDESWLFSPMAIILMSIGLWFASPLFIRLTSLKHASGITFNSIYILFGGIILIGLALIINWLL